MTGIILGIVRIIASIFFVALVRLGVAIAVKLQQRALVPPLSQIVADAIRHLCRPPARWSAS